MALEHKIDFALVFTAHNANPNGDPLDGNRPRTTYSGLGEVSDVCLKRKVRNRWIDDGYPVFVQSDNRRSDEFRSLRCLPCSERMPCRDRCAEKEQKERGDRYQRGLRTHRLRTVDRRPFFRSGLCVQR